MYRLHTEYVLSFVFEFYHKEIFELIDILPNKMNFLDAISNFEKYVD